MELSEAEIGRLRAGLDGAEIDGLVDLMVRTLFGDAPEAAGPEARALAAELGWIDPATGRFTEIGWLAADSCREYRFWTERGRRLPFEGAAGHLRAEHFRGRSVLELGCGMGANLMSLAGVAGGLAGLEPVAVYRQLGAVFREREGLPQIDIRAGSAEAIPLPDAGVDVVLCVSAHQYMDIHAALAEIARVLRPGGEALIVGGTIDSYLRAGLEPVRRGSLRGLKPYGETILNTLAYRLAGRRMILRRSAWATAHPIYPDRAFMRRALRRAGLVPEEPFVRVPPETCFRALKPGGGPQA